MLSVVFLPLLGFVAAASVLTITPGVDTAMVLRNSTSNGPKAGAAAGLGICAGLLVWGVGAPLGLTALLAASAAVFTVLKWVGAAYLLYLGVKLIAKPRAVLSTDQIIERVYEAAWARVERDVFRDTAKDEERKTAPRQWTFVLADTHPVDFDTLSEKLATIIPKPWITTPTKKGSPPQSARNSGR
jgi:hypothetical protein